MERKKKTALLLGTVGLISVLMVSFLGIGSQPILALPESSQSSGSPSLVPAVAIPGNTYTGKYIRIGVNKGGTFCVSPAGAVPGTGFQFPIGPQYESLAIGWWGEGYAVFYKFKTAKGWVDNVAYWWPDLGWPFPAASNLKFIYAKQNRNDTNRAIYTVRVQTLDKALNLTFKFSFPKPQKYVLLQTTITNNGAKGTLRDVLYKRIVDWDIHGNIPNNVWTSDVRAAYASYFNKTLNKWVTMSVAGYTPTGLENEVSYVDLFAWDDNTWPLTPTRDPGSYDIQSHDQPLTGDGCAAIYYDLGGDMASGATKNVMTVYQAGWHFDHGIATTTHTLTIKIALFTPGKTNPPPGTYTYSEGDTATVTAINGPDSYFGHWELDGYYYGTTNPISITMNEDHTLVAFFGPG